MSSWQAKQEILKLAGLKWRIGWIDWAANFVSMELRDVVRNRLERSQVLFRKPILGLFGTALV